MTRRPDPAAFRERLLARLSGAPTPKEKRVASEVSEARRVINARNVIRNAQRRGALKPKDWQSALDHWGHRCVYCGRQVADKAMNKDHWVPLDDGGTLARSNVVPACGACNRKKHNTPPLEYMVGIGKLTAYVEIDNYLTTLR